MSQPSYEICSRILIPDSQEEGEIVADLLQCAEKR